jgi:hypothetical protein
MREISVAALGALFLVAGARSQATSPAQVSATEAPGDVGRGSQKNCSCLRGALGQMAKGTEDGIKRQPASAEIQAPPRTGIRT